MARLIASESAAFSHPNPAAAAARVLDRVSANLSRFIGNDGCLALMMRARSRAEAAHPSLKTISIVANSNLAVHGMAEGIQAFGAAEIAAGLESTLASLLDLLGRLIGDELAVKLVEQNSTGGEIPEDGVPQ